MELEAEKCIQSKQHIYTQYTTPLKASCHVMIFSLCWKRISRFGQGQGIDHALAFGIFETKCAEVTSNQILRSTFCAKQHRVRIQWFSLPHRKVYGTVWNVQLPLSILQSSLLHDGTLLGRIRTRSAYTSLYGTLDGEHYGNHCLRTWDVARCSVESELLPHCRINLCNGQVTHTWWDLAM